MRSTRRNGRRARTGQQPLEENAVKTQKLIAIEHGWDVSWFVGSANLTAAAFLGRNVEVMASVTGRKGRKGAWASSVMLLDCAKLRHWDAEQGFREMFEFKRDYQQWISLELEDRETIGLFEDYWNDFDRLDENTRLLHNTKRVTQPWKTGLPVDFRQLSFRWFPPKGWLKEARRRIFGDYGLAGHYQPHPDPEQERFFFGLLRECLDQGIVSESALRDEMRQNHVRHDALEVLAHMG